MHSSPNTTISKSSAGNMRKISSMGLERAFLSMAHTPTVTLRTLALRLLRKKINMCAPVVCPLTGSLLRFCNIEFEALDKGAKERQSVVEGKSVELRGEL